MCNAARLVALLLTAGLSGLIPSPARADVSPAAVPPDASELARKVVELPQFRDMALHALLDEVRDPMFKQLAVPVAGVYDPLWMKLASGLAQDLHTSLTPRQIESSLDRISSEPYAVWNEHREIFAKHAREADEVEGRPSDLPNYALTCVIKSLAPEVALAVENARSAGEDFPIDQAMVERNADKVQGLIELCTCVMGKAMEHFGFPPGSGRLNGTYREHGAFASQLIADKVCTIDRLPGA